jgi:hypothetical protein
LKIGSHFLTEVLFTFPFFLDEREATMNPTKMKGFKFLPMVLFLGVLSFSSCNDEDDPTPPTKSELVTAKNWSTSGLSVKPAINIDQNVTYSSSETLN